MILAIVVFAAIAIYLFVKYHPMRKKKKFEELVASWWRSFPTGIKMNTNGFTTGFNGTRTTKFVFLIADTRSIKQMISMNQFLVGYFYQLMRFKFESDSIPTNFKFVLVNLNTKEDFKDLLIKKFSEDEIRSSLSLFLFLDKAGKMTMDMHNLFSKMDDLSLGNRCFLAINHRNNVINKVRIRPLNNYKLDGGIMLGDSIGKFPKYYNLKTLVKFFS